MKKILLLEDDETLLFGLENALKKEAFSVSCCSTMTEGLVAFSPELDLIIADLNLPDGSGYDFCRHVRERSDIPLIFLTVRNEEKDMVHGFSLGADDYVVKPFHLPVLLSRIHAILRRTKRVAPETDQKLTCGSVSLDLQQTSARVRGTEISLTQSEYRLLLVLMTNKNQTLTRGQLLDKLWDTENNFVNDNTLTVTVKRLREKLGGDEIKTVRGLGYRMEE